MQENSILKQISWNKQSNYFTYTRYKNNINFTVVKGLNQSDGEKAFDYSTKQFEALVSNRPTYTLAFIKRGLNVIYTDVDTIWLKDPRSFLNGDYDKVMIILIAKDNATNCQTYLESRSKLWPAQSTLLKGT
jgi:hypothetical protein